MACIKGKSTCEICKKRFEWRRHDTQKPASTCGRECKLVQSSVRLIERNEKQFKYKNVTEEEKLQRFKENFDKKVIRKEGCWDWRGFCDKDGYAQFTGHNGKTVVPIKAHRFSYEIHKGKIPESMCVCHTCDNPRCTNPDHLWLGTAKENSEDIFKKGRGSIGEKRPLAKLKDSDIREIRKMIELGVTVAFLARKYNVHYMCIQNVKKGKTWKHVEV